jgi:DNA-binding NarL/FixJ family response regulator
MPDPAPEPRPRPSALSGEGPVTVVTIDDNADLRRLYRLAFEGSPLQVVGEAPDGRRGVDVVRAAQPALVLLDLSMPDMDGLETLLELRAAAPEARVVVLSGFTRDRLGPVVAELGAVDYVEKGVRPTELMARLLDAARAPLPPARPPTAMRMRELRGRLTELV